MSYLKNNGGERGKAIERISKDCRMVYLGDFNADYAMTLSFSLVYSKNFIERKKFSFLIIRESFSLKISSIRTKFKSFPDELTSTGISLKYLLLLGKTIFALEISKFKSLCNNVI